MRLLYLGPNLLHLWGVLPTKSAKILFCNKSNEKKVAFHTERDNRRDKWVDSYYSGYSRLTEY